MLSVNVGALARQFLPEPLWPSRTQRTVGLLELHWYYGLQICSSTFRGLGCEASMKSVSRLHRSLAIQAYREFLVWGLSPPNDSDRKGTLCCNGVR